MALNPPAAGLRRLHLNSKSAAKVALVVAPGDVLEVSDEVAAQLVRQGNFDDGDPQFDPTFPAPEPEPEPDAEGPADEPEPEPADTEPEPQVEAAGDDGEPASTVDVQPKGRGRGRARP